MVKNSPANAGDMGLITYVRKIPRSRKWQPTPVFLPGKSNGQRNQVDYSPELQRVGHDLDNNKHIRSRWESVLGS